MPLIEYTCKDCGINFKRLIFLGDEETPSVCPSCKGTTIERLEGAEGLFQGISNQSSLAGDRN
jgi:putative FmdB family regulatory protein